MLACKVKFRSNFAAMCALGMLMYILGVYRGHVSHVTKYKYFIVLCRVPRVYIKLLRTFS